MCTAGVNDLAMGDAVFGVAPGCLGRSVVVTRDLVVPKPPSISFEDAATTPTVYVTVFQAFGDLGSFSSNTKVTRSLCAP
jgi:NADPH:quinone reductase-like Zn-dependent oxidoreductase